MQIGDCSALLKYDLLIERKVSSRYERVQRRRVNDFVMTKELNTDRAIVKLTRCSYLASPSNRWAAREEMVHGHCPQAVGQPTITPLVALIEYRRGQGAVCELEIATNEQGERIQTRRQLVGHASEDCLNVEGAKYLN
jgi:hypothetical protein